VGYFHKEMPEKVETKVSKTISRIRDGTILECSNDYPKGEFCKTHKSKGGVSLGTFYHYFTS